MWRAQAGQKVSVSNQNDSDDDWETEADYENNVDDKLQRKEASTFGDALGGKVVQVSEKSSWFLLTGFC